MHNINLSFIFENPNYFLRLCFASSHVARFIHDLSQLLSVSLSGLVSYSRELMHVLKLASDKAYQLHVIFLRFFVER